MWILLLAMTLPYEGPCIRDTVDKIEVNHYCDDQGKVQFRQVIFWRWDTKNARWEVAAWRQWNGRYPLRMWDRGGIFIYQWYDKKDECFREVASRINDESYTPYDPEIQNRELVPQNRRSGLTRPRRKPK